MTGFRPLFGDDAPEFQPLQPEGATLPGGAPATRFAPLMGPRAEPVRPGPAPTVPEAAPVEVDEAPAPEPEPVQEEAEDVGQLMAREQGFALGREQGLAAAEAAVADKVGELQALVEELTGLRARLFRQSVQDLGQAIMHISERVVGRELAVDSSGVERLVIEVLGHVQSDDEVVIRIAPENERQMRNAAPSVLEHLGRDATFRIEVDQTQQPGGIRVETQLGSIDASVETRFRAFEESVRAWVTEELGADED